jgi:hypothetical protein
MSNHTPTNTLQGVRAGLQELADNLNWEAHEREVAQARANPVKYKLTLCFEGGDPNYRGYEGPRDRRGRQVFWLWSTKRNAAGYFLFWREVHDKDGTIKRDKWFAHKTKRRLIERAQRFAGVTAGSP